MQTEVLGGKGMLARYSQQLCAPVHFDFKSREEWGARRETVRKHVLASLGLDPMPERVPLDVKYGGTLDRGDYILKRVYWQTWPNVYASGWLYLPKADGRRPAVLNPHGHWPSGFFSPVVQSRCIGLALKGYVALVVDSVHVFGPRGKEAGLPGFPVGISTIGIMTWNNIRAIDLLEALPEVDTSRIGCTGASGGGQQTMYMMAAEDRLAAAVPAVMVSYFGNILHYQEVTHCYCNFLPDLLKCTDMPEMAAAFAPKPALYLAVTGDWTRRVPQEEFPEIQGIYSLYGAEDRTACKQWEMDHNYDRPLREAMYAWFNKWLCGIEDPEAAQEPALQVENPETLRSLNLPGAMPSIEETSAYCRLSGTRSFDEVRDDYLERLGFKSPQPKEASEWQTYLGNLRADLTRILSYEPVAGQLAGEPLETRREVYYTGVPMIMLTVKSEPEIEVPALLLPAGTCKREPAAVLIHPEGKKGVVENYNDLVDALRKAGIAVFLPDVRLTGELGAVWHLNTTIWGRPETGMALTDLHACLDVLDSCDGLDTSRIALVGLGDSGVTALFAGALEPRFTSVFVERVGRTYANGRTTPVISNILKTADLPQVAASIAPRTLLLGGASDEFGFTSQAFAALGYNGKLAIQPCEVPTADLAARIAADLSPA